MENPSLPRVTACLMNMSALVQESFDAINQLQSLNQVFLSFNQVFLSPSLNFKKKGDSYS